MVSVQSVKEAETGEVKEVELPLDVFIGRQPVLDEKLQLWGYELLYRGVSDAEEARFDSDFEATASVVVNTLADLGIERVAGRSRMLINCTAPVLQLEVLEMLPAHQITLEVLEHVEASEETVARVRELRAHGFQVALDDYSGNEMSKAWLPEVDLVKVDLTLVDEEQLPAMVEELKHFKVTLLAEKVETRGQFELCAKLGFKFFQGYHFSRPEIVRGKRPPANQLALLRLLSKVNDPDTPREELVKLVSSDVGLSFRLLRCLNSVAFSLAREVQTVEHALSLLGVSRLREWVSMLTVSRIPNKPTELSRLALLRAHMCAALAERIGNVDPRAVFTVGLFSVLDTMMDVKMSKVVKELPLAKEIENALLGKPSALSAILGAVLSYENGDFSALKAMGLRPEQLTAIWMESTRTMEDSFDFMITEADDSSEKRAS